MDIILAYKNMNGAVCMVPVSNPHVKEAEITYRGRKSQVCTNLLVINQMNADGKTTQMALIPNLTMHHYLIAQVEALKNNNKSTINLDVQWMQDEIEQRPDYSVRPDLLNVKCIS